MLASLRAQFGNVRWLSAEGELPGYDIDYEQDGVRHAVEVIPPAGRLTFASIQPTFDA